MQALKLELDKNISEPQARLGLNFQSLSSVWAKNGLVPPVQKMEKYIYQTIKMFNSTQNKPAFWFEGLNV